MSLEEITPFVERVKWSNPICCDLTSSVRN